MIKGIEISFPGVFPHIFSKITLDYHLLSATSISRERIESLWVLLHSNNSTFTELHTCAQKHYYLRKQISIELITDSSNEARIINTFNPLQNPSPLGCPKRKKMSQCPSGKKWVAPTFAIRETWQYLESHQESLSLWLTTSQLLKHAQMENPQHLSLYYLRGKEKRGQYHK